MTAQSTRDRRQALARGRAAADRLARAEAAEALAAADRMAALGPDDLETLATASYLLGRGGDALDALRRAWRGHLDAGAPRRAARCGFWLVFHLRNAGEPAQAAGWAARVERRRRGGRGGRHGQGGR